MRPSALSSLMLALILVSSLATAGDQPELTREPGVIHGGSLLSAKAGGDTINLMSFREDPTNGPGEPFYLGDFENAAGRPDWNGWTSLDVTQATESNYQVSDYGFAPGANLAAWCGDIDIPSCVDSLDPPGGYGNSWNEQLQFTARVPDHSISAAVMVGATLYNDTEPGYDYTYLSYQYHDERLADIASWDGAQTVDVNGSVVYLPEHYVDGSDVRLLFRFESDGGWSDEDCSWPTIRGAHQIDDITVTIIQAGHPDQVFFEDFEGGDLNLGNGREDPGSYLWRVSHPYGVGDFGGIWEGLEDLDPCAENSTPQVAFIDDGEAVPGTGGSECITWCYGPGGYVVNSLGGLAGPTEHLYNVVESPAMAWPAAGYAGIQFEFDVYRHFPLDFDSPSIFYMWSVRSADLDGSAGEVQALEDQPWVDRNFLYMSETPEYYRQIEEVTDLMNPGRDVVQVQLGVFEAGWIWYPYGNDATPAPYYDNVKVQVYPVAGPAMAAREIDLANDGFPERGSIDFADLGSMHVRFDMARNISLDYHQIIDFGDSIVVDILPVREGSELHGTPRIVYAIGANPVFDAHRTAPTNGSVDGLKALNAAGIWDGRTWAFDLPDTGLMFPGDVLHYYIQAEDAIGGADVRTATMPVDLSGFGEFSDPLAYDSTFIVRALPTIHYDGLAHSTPSILFWNDCAGLGGENKWIHAFNHAGKVVGQDYDIYATNGPSSGVGNGLGGRAGGDLVLEHYSDMIYTAGDLGAFTISNGDFQHDPSDDVGVLTSWLLQGDKDIFLTGDGLASDLAFHGGPAALTFAEDWLGVSCQVPDVRSFLDNQATPLVKADPGNPVFQNVASWVAYGGCPGINTFDGVTALGSATQLAEFAAPTGETGAYPYSAATLNIPDTPGTSRVLSLPYDLMFVYTDASGKADVPLADRSLMVRDVISWFGLPVHPPTEVPRALTFSARNHPNPFNPATKITYTVPRAGHLSLKVFDIRGRLVRTLVDERVEAGADQVTVWDGTDGSGAAVSSGVYFYEARTGGEVKVGKMALVK